MGRSALYAVLMARGFSEKAIEVAVNDAYVDTTEREVAARFLQSLPVRFTDAMREARRRAAALTARGFPEEMIEPLLVSGLSDQGAG